MFILLEQNEIIAKFLFTIILKTNHYND